MNLTQLNCFIAVAETLSFTKAAERLNYVQSAVSSNIAELEAEIGVELFVRTNRYVRLTPVGELLLGNAYKIVSQIDEFHSKCDRFNHGQTGNLAVGYVFSPTMRSVQHLFERFAKDQPEVSISLHSYIDGNMANAACDKDVDLIVTCPNTIRSYQNMLDYRALFKEDYRVVANLKHRLAGEKRIELGRLCSDDFCVMDRRINTGLYGDTITMCTKAGFSPRIISQCNTLSALLLTLEMNTYISILPASWEKHILANNKLFFIDLDGTDAERVVGLAWNKKNANPTLKQFLAQCDSYIHQG